MPVVTAEMWECRMQERKRALVVAITEAMVRHADASRDHLHVIIHEVPKENWARAGRLGSEPEV